MCATAALGDGPLFSVASPITARGETTWSEISALCPRILLETTDARLDAKRGAGDQPSSSERNAPAGILICDSLPGGLVCAAAAPIPLYNIYRAEDGFANAGISMAIVAYAVGTIAALLVLGRLSNHLGRRLTAIASLGLLLQGCLRFLNVHDIGTLLAGRLLVGVGTGLASSSLTSYIVLGLRILLRIRHRHVRTRRRAWRIRIGLPGSRRPIRGNVLWVSHALFPSCFHRRETGIRMQRPGTPAQATSPEWGSTLLE
jgi:hypothetical protein